MSELVNGAGRRLARRGVMAIVAVVLGAAASVGAIQSASAATTRPCDIYGAAGTPCVAAHSTTRALFAAYNGPLYQVTRASDGATKDIGLLAAGGYANADAQDTFCASTTCTITRIYDQTARHNDLTVEGAGGNGAADRPSAADALPVMAGGHAVYGLSISAGNGYRNDSTSGVAVNGQPEGMYMVTSGTHVNGGCCFDYGNAETNNNDTGNGHMDAVNFGTEAWFSQYGSGPWVQADLENGLFSSDSGASKNPSYTGDTAPFVTALLKNNGQDHFALKDGNAQTKTLTTVYSGPEPTAGGYSPMHQEGAIVLGTGGDNSNASIGSFFEGVMTAGMPTDAADNAVQANIAAVGYGGSTGVTGSLAKNSEISLQATTPGYTDHYITHQNDIVVSEAISSSTSSQVKGDATWIVRPGLANASCVSFESRDYPGDFLRHQNFQLHRQPMDGSDIFRQDATFCPKTGVNGQGQSFESLNYPGRYIRHYNNTLYIASDGGPNSFDDASHWTDDVSFLVDQPWAP